MDQSEKNRKIEEALNSFDGASRANPKPFLLTRINARLAQEAEQNFWSRAGAYLSRPLVAGIGLMIFLMINLLAVNIINKNKSSKAVAAQLSANNTYEFAINVTSLYDTENQEP